MIKNKIKLNLSTLSPKHICDFWPAKVSVQQKTISLFPPHYFARIHITELCDLNSKLLEAFLIH